MRQITQLVPRLIDPALPPRVARGMHHRPVFSDTLVWLEIFGDAPDAVEKWKQARHTRQHRRRVPHPPLKAASRARRRPAAVAGDDDGDAGADEDHGQHRRAD